MRIRVKFTKTGNMKYIGHLDVMRYFQKVLRRADIDVSFSGGFSPHMIMSFASPLGVGTTSSAEYFDLDIQSATSSKDMMDRMNAQMCQGMSIVGIRKIKEDKASKGMTLVAAADYKVALDLSELEPALAKKIADQANAANLKEKIAPFMEQEEVTVWRKTKRSEGEVNIRPWIYSFSCEDASNADSTKNAPSQDCVCNCTVGNSGNCDGELQESAFPVVFSMQVSQGSVANLKPDLVVKAFAEYAGFEIPDGTLRIHRQEIYANLGSEKKIRLVPLGRLGEKIE